MNAMQAIKIGELATRQQSDTDVETQMLHDRETSHGGTPIRVKFMDRFSMDLYTLDGQGQVLEETLGQRV